MQNDMLIITIFRFNSEEMFVNCPEEGWQREARLSLALLLWPGLPTVEAAVPELVLSLATTGGLSLATQPLVLGAPDSKQREMLARGGGALKGCPLPPPRMPWHTEKGRGWDDPWSAKLPLTPISSTSLSTHPLCLTRCLICLIPHCSFAVAVAFTFF